MSASEEVAPVQTQDPFSSEVIAAIMRHMNVDHSADCLLICKGLGGQLDAQSAMMTGMDPDGINFVALVDGKQVPVHLPWYGPLVERAQVRGEVTRMYHDALTALGMEPPEAHAEEAHA
jgi:hypothetical protein